jgi:anaerobic magnesium-protoporphyrin IX monomethyl ester cyclase
MWLSGRRALQFETSRGCPFRCAFCYNTSVRLGQWRALTAPTALRRLKQLVDEYNIRAFAFSDDNFFTDPGRARDILQGIIRSKLDIVWGKGDIRLDLLAQLDDDFLKLIRDSGCLSLVIGVESGSQRIANLLRKEIDVSRAITVNRRLAAHSIDPRYLFLVGIPGDTEDDLQQTADMMLALTRENPRATVAVQIFVPYPGTELFDLAIQSGLQAPQKLEDWIYFSWSNRSLDYPWISRDRKLFPGER